MSWNARRYIPGKPILRAVRHQKKILSREKELAETHAVPDQIEIDRALQYAHDHRLFRLAAMLVFASNYRSVAVDLAFAKQEIKECERECDSWKFRYLQERQRVLALEAKIGSLRRSRQTSRTRMRAGTPGIRSSFPGSKR